MVTNFLIPLRQILPHRPVRCSNSDYLPDVMIDYRRLA